jgi:hypothetical protein
MEAIMQVQAIGSRNSADSGNSQVSVKRNQNPPKPDAAPATNRTQVMGAFPATVDIEFTYEIDHRTGGIKVILMNKDSGKMIREIEVIPGTDNHSNKGVLFESLA